MYQVFLKSCYQECPELIDEEVMYEVDNIEDAYVFLKNNAEHFIEFYPLVEIGIRLKNYSGATRPAG